MRYSKILIIVSSLAVTACDPFSMPSLILNGADLVTWLKTGKTVSDHVISEAAGKDCAVWRVIKGQKICSKTDKQLVDEMMWLDCEWYAWDEKDQVYCKEDEE